MPEEKNKIAQQGEQRKSRPRPASTITVKKASLFGVELHGIAVGGLGPLVVVAVTVLLVAAIFVWR